MFFGRADSHRREDVDDAQQDVRPGEREGRHDDAGQGLDAELAGVPEEQAGFPKNRPLGPVGLIRVDAKRPVAIVPQIPPAPWHAKTSRESSRVVRALQLPT